MKINRKEAEQYRKQLADDYYNKKISWQKYNELWDSIELEPYDLSEFSQLKDRTVNWINRLFENAPANVREGYFKVRGFTRCESAEMQLLNLNYGDYADGLSFYAYNDKEHLIYEFTEGDTVLQIFADEDSYNTVKEATREWYKNERS